MHFLEALRTANVARNTEWEMPSNPFSAVFWVNELAGEAGEACNILKKLDRERIGVRGSRATLGALSEELADVVICFDLLGMHQGIVFPNEACWGSRTKQAEPDYSRLGASIMSRVGRACMLVVNGHPAPMSLLPPVLNDGISYTKAAADWLGIDLERSVATKFNMTSEKVGLKTRLVL